MAELEVCDLDFYQNDYTNASAWEVFNFNLEELLNSLNSFRNSQDGKHSGQWQRESKTTTLQELDIDVSIYWRDIDESQDENDPKSSSQFTFSDEDSDLGFILPPLWKWYGLSTFIVVSAKEDDVIPEHHLKTAQSSLIMAVAETDCSVPVFMRVLSKRANMFLGVSDKGSIRTNYEMIFLMTLPANYKCFTGLYEIFKGKVGLSTDATQVAVRVCYSTSELKDFLELEQQPEPDDLRYPFGVQTDPIKSIVLHCVWPELPSSVVLHNYTNYDGATKATDWILQAVFDENAIEILSDFVEEFLDEMPNEEALISDSNSELKLPGGFPGVGFSSSAKQNWSKLRQERPNESFPAIPDDIVKKFLYFLFPDADTDGESPKVYKWDNEKPSSLSTKMKTGAKDCLIHRLSLAMTISYANYGGDYGLKYLWNEFFNEIRYRVDHSIEIPGISAGFPDYHTCLLHQKLQMVNVCIQRRQQRQRTEGGTGLDDEVKSSGGENSEDEFFDCEEDEAVFMKPIGRLSPLGDLVLVHRPEEKLYIPETQDAVVKTEDELENDADVMLKLGPGSDLSSQMMSLSLQSDMSSFKAANPRAKIEDFIRWYSPRDWIVNEETGEGHMSERMMIPGNTWQTVWASAKPIPAKKQKCLFDDAKEVEKVMCYLEQMKLGDLVYMILPCLMEDAYSTLVTELEKVKQFLGAEIFGERVPKLLEQICRYSRDFWSVASQGNSKSAATSKWRYAIHEIRQLENVATRTKNLCEKLKADQESLGSAEEVAEDGLERDALALLIRGLMSGKPTVVPGGPRNAKWREILQLFSSQSQESSEGDVASTEVEREFVFRMAKQVGAGDVVLPQFMRVLLKPNEYRICGAFSQHVNIVYE